MVKAKYFAGSLVAPFRKALAFQRYPSPEDTIIRHLIFELVEIKTFCRAKIFLEKLEIATFLLECKWRNNLAAVNIQKFPAREQAGSMTTDVTCKWWRQKFSILPLIFYKEKREDVIWGEKCQNIWPQRGTGLKINLPLHNNNVIDQKCIKQNP